MAVHLVVVRARDQGGVVELLALHAREGEPGGGGGGDAAGGLGAGEPGGAAELQVGDQVLGGGDVLGRADHPADVDDGGVGRG